MSKRGEIASGKPKSTSRTQDYLCSIKYHNSLPAPPSGLFFTEFGIPHPSNEFAEYKVSSLEKGFIWEPHFGPDLGLNLDLVDQEAILISDASKVLDPLDKIFLSDIAEKNKGRSNKASEDKNHWWLRKTTYLENNLFGHTIMQRTDGTEARRKKPSADETAVDHYSELYIKESFENAGKFKRILEQKKKSQVEWSLDLLPNSDLDSLMLSFARFSEPVFPSSDTFKLKKRMRSSVVTNVRALGDSKLTKQTAFGSSLASLPDDKIDAENGEHDCELEWIKDFVMEIQKSQIEDTFFIVLNPSSVADGSASASRSGTALYTPIAARMEFHKLPLEDSEPIDVTIIRS